MCDEFGFINQQNIFSQKFLFYYKADINISSLDLFLKENFKNEIYDKSEHLKIYDGKKSIIGYSYSLKYIKKIEISENQDNIIFDGKEENSSIKNEDKNNNEILNKKNKNNQQNTVYCIIGKKRYMNKSGTPFRKNLSF